MKGIGVVVLSAVLAGFVATSSAQVPDAKAVSDTYTAYSGPVRSSADGGGILLAELAKTKLVRAVAAVVVEELAERLVDAVRSAGSSDGALKVAGLANGDVLFDLPTAN